MAPLRLLTRVMFEVKSAVHFIVNGAFGFLIRNGLTFRLFPAALALPGDLRGLGNWQAYSAG